MSDQVHGDARKFFVLFPNYMPLYCQVVEVCLLVIFLIRIGSVVS